MQMTSRVQDVPCPHGTGDVSLLSGFGQAIDLEDELASFILSVNSKCILANRQMPRASHASPVLVRSQYLSGNIF